MTTLSSLLPPTNVGNVTGTLAATNGGTGLTSPGTVGNLLASNGTAWVSQAPAAAGPTLDAIASGSLSDGSTVIVNADGTVSVVGIAPQTVGPETVFNSANTPSLAAAYDVNAQRVVIAYQNAGNSSFGTAVVGTVSGTSISFGTPVVFKSDTTTNLAATYHAAQQKVVVAYLAVSQIQGRTRVGTVSGTSISFGSEVFFNSGDTSHISMAYDAGQQRVVFAYRDSANSDFGTARVGTVSGTSISFGDEVVFNSSPTSFTSAAYDANAQRVVIAYQDGGNSNFGTARVGTVSGTNISFGSSVQFSTVEAEHTATAYDANAQKVVIAYAAASSGGTAIVGTVSGTSISFGAEVVFNAASTENVEIVYNQFVQKTIVTYRDGGNSGFGTAIVGTVSGTSISFGAEVVFNAGNTGANFPIYDAVTGRNVIPYTDSGNSAFGTSVVFQNQSTNLTAENFIGFSDGAYTNGQTATIQLGGAVDDAQSGLTPGQAYYVQLDGSLGLTPASPSVLAGKAVASTKILVKG